MSQNRSLRFRLDDSEEVGMFSVFQAIVRTMLSGNRPVSRKTLNLLLLGKTGYGKSATGNTALGRKEFESKSSTSSVTSQVKCEEVYHGDYLVKIVDSPGLADTKFGTNRAKEMEEAIRNMDKAMEMCHVGIHAFVFVVKFGNRFTKEDVNTLHCLRQIFGHFFLAKNGVILFTHGDLFEESMEEDNTKWKDFSTWCREQRGPLSDLIKECSYRCVLFNNRLKGADANHAQMDSLVQLVERCDEPYQYLDYILCDPLRTKLIVELKEPQLKETFDREMLTVRSTMDVVCGPGKTPSEGEITNLETSISALCVKIASEDRGTGVLRGTKEKAESLQILLDQHKRRLAEESSCSIL